jgi:hypothetical protein
MRVRTLIVIAVGIVVGGVILGDVSRVRRQRRDLSCLGNVYNLALAMQMYLADSSYTFPDSDRWVDALSEYIVRPSVLKCPLETSSARTSYAMNEQLSGLHFDKLSDPSHTVILYETKHPGDSASGGPDDVVSPPRHTWGNAYAFGDAGGRWSEEIPRFEP